ncbi:unnamed protein product [Ectocarpus sp. 6 AP-2014]
MPKDRGQLLPRHQHLASMGRVRKTKSWTTSSPPS